VLDVLPIVGHQV